MSISMGISTISNIAEALGIKLIKYVSTTAPSLSTWELVFAVFLSKSVDTTQTFILGSNLLNATWKQRLEKKNQ
jgi:hypothetical protein